MRQHWLIGLSLIVIAAIAGCQEHPLFNEGWADPRPLAAGIDAYRPPTDPTENDFSASVHRGIDGVVTLRRALAAALMSNPQLASFSWEVRIREARALQAGLWPNPEASVEVENFAGTGATRSFDSAETTVSLSQLIPLADKVQKRSRVANLDRDLAGWDYEAARIAVATEVTRALVNVEAVQRRIELARKNVELAEQVYQAADKRVQAGAAVPLERTRAGVVAETSRIALQRAERALTAARHRLSATWGSTDPAFDRVAADLETIRPVPPYEGVRRRAAQNPELARWATEISQRMAVVELAKAQAVPDVTAGAGVRRLNESDDTAAVMQFSVPVPLFDRNQGGILEARFAAAKARQDRRAAEVRVGTVLAQAYQELAAAYTEAHSLRQTVLPAAQEAFDATNQSYQEGKRSYLEVLDAQRSLFEARGQYIDALATYHAATAEVEGLIGQSLKDGADDGRNNAERPVPGDKP